jgi:hypothetical protein
MILVYELVQYVYRTEPGHNYSCAIAPGLVTGDRLLNELLCLLISQFAQMSTEINSD